MQRENLTTKEIREKNAHIFGGKYGDDFDGYSPEEYEELKKWISEHVEPVKKIQYNNAVSTEYLGNLISGQDIAYLAGLDCGTRFDHLITRLAMSEIDPSPVKIEGCPVLYYHAMWKNIFSSDSSEKWRVE